MALNLLVDEKGERVALARKGLQTVEGALRCLERTSREGMLVEGIAASKVGVLYNGAAIKLLLGAEEKGCDHPLLYLYIGDDYAKEGRVGSYRGEKAREYYDKAVQSRLRYISQLTQGRLILSVLSLHDVSVVLLYYILITSLFYRIYPIIPLLTYRRLCPCFPPFAPSLSARLSPSQSRSY